MKRSVMMAIMSGSLLITESVYAAQHKLIHADAVNWVLVDVNYDPFYGYMYYDPDKIGTYRQGKLARIKFRYDSGAYTMANIFLVALATV